MEKNEHSQEYWSEFSKEDWENPRSVAVAAFVRLRNSQDRGFIQLARAACTAAGADWQQFAGHASKAILEALASDKDKKRPEQLAQELETDKPAKLVCLGSVEPQKMSWLWHPYIPANSMTIIQGDPGSGKTHLAAWLAAMVTTGNMTPDLQTIDKGSVIFQSMEDGLAEGLVPRLIAAGADMNKVHCFDEDENALHVQDLGRIESAFKEIKDLKLFVIDPIQSYLGAKTDMNRANEIREALRGLLALCKKYNVALVMIGHLGKAQNKNLYRLIGSMDFVAQARSVLTVGENAAAQGERLVLPTKTSNAKMGEPWGFTITDSGVQFAGFRPGMTEFNLRPQTGDEDNRVDEAIRFLLETLKDKPMTVREIEVDGRGADMKSATLKRAREKMKIDKLLSVRKVGQRGTWYWFLSGKQVVEIDGRMTYLDQVELLELHEKNACGSKPESSSFDDQHENVVDQLENRYQQKQDKKAREVQEVQEVQDAQDAQEVQDVQDAQEEQSLMDMVCKQQ